MLNIHYYADYADYAVYLWINMSPSDRAVAHGYKLHINFLLLDK